MELSARIRSIFVVLAIVLLLFGSIFAMVTIARNIFRGNPEPTVDRPALTELRKSGLRVTLEAQGPIVAKEDFDSYRISISRNERLLQIFDGYGRRIVNEHRFSNTPEAFDAFIAALERNRFDSLNNSFADESEIGFCPTGSRFIYATIEDGFESMRTWNTSCRRNQGSSRISIDARNLFRAQIPEFRDLVRGLNVRR